MDEHKNTEDTQHKAVPSDFNPAEYLLINNDVLVAGNDPYEHFISYGHREGRAYKIDVDLPNDFDSESYLRLNPDVLQSGMDPVLHYKFYGIREGRIYVAEDIKLFDAEWYLDEYPELANLNVDLFEHYIKYGRNEGRHPRFDPEWYIKEYSDVADSGIDPLQHYKNNGRSEFRHPAFNKIWYLSEYNDVFLSNIDPFEHYNIVGKIEGRNPAFNKYWYLSEYRDVADAGFDPYYHYNNNGKGEGRYPCFNASWYAREYPDVKQTDLSDYDHYIVYGKKAGYKPCPTQEMIRSYSVRLDNFPVSYDSEYQPQQDFSLYRTEIKALAFYLPQFHESEENNKWWGQGFTEWTNTKKSHKRFDTHYQPREPHKDIGYYDLSDKDQIISQVRLAKNHGIYGFCFYHYWFSGKRALEKPVDIILQNRDIDIPFCLCWANENWTKTWDGQEDNVLLKQDYSDSDPITFISDIAKYLDDQRYIKIDNKPVLIVYKAHLIPNVEGVFATWKRFWKDRTGNDLIIWCNRTEPSDYQLKYINADYDAVVEFPPHVVASAKHVSRYVLKQQFANINDTGNYYDYQRVVEDIISGKDYTSLPEKPFYRGVMLGWDNSARRSEGQSIWFGFSLKTYYQWLTHIIKYTRSNFPDKERFVFINAWNEWAEGTYLEPDVKTGYASINTTSRALYGLPFSPASTVLNPALHQYSNKKIAVHLHVYFVDQLRELIENIQTIKHNYDLIITTDSESKKDSISDIILELLPNINTRIILSENRGRDIGPLMMDVAKILLSYDIFGHFHTKKSSTVDWGNDWRRYLIDNLIGKNGSADAIINDLDGNQKLGVVSTPTYPVIAPHVSWGNVKTRCSELLSEIGCDMLLPSDCRFPVGNMFWAKVPAVAQILEHNFNRYDFEEENLQVGQTLPHCIERIWGYLASYNGYEYKEVLAGCSFDKSISINSTKKRICLFVHFNEKSEVSSSDLFLISKLNKICSDIVFVSNSELNDESVDKVSRYASSLIVRDNKGYDFSAWKEAINYVGWINLLAYDEVIFANNSCYGPIIPFEDIFEEMDLKQCDFWGITSFPELHNSSRPEASLLSGRNIDPHVQSYFMVVRPKLLHSVTFFQFWDKLEPVDEFMEVVTRYEIGFTKQMVAGGFKWEVLIPVSSKMQQENSWDPRFNLPYNKPYDLLILKSPLIKKRAWDYAGEEMWKTLDLVDSIGYMPSYMLLK